MTKAANLANLASNTNFGILNIWRGGTGRGAYHANGALHFTTGNNIIQVGTLPTNVGGTGLASFNIGGALYATSNNTLTSNTLPVTSGGTGGSELANGCILIGRGLNPVDTIAPGSPNNVIISDGTKWYSANATTRGIGIIPKPAAANNILVDTGNDWVSYPSYGLFLNPGTANSTYVSNGTAWISRTYDYFDWYNQGLFGYQQTLTDRTGVRTLSTSYTNSTNKPMIVNFVWSSTTSASAITVTANVGAITVASNTIRNSGDRQSMSFLVPASNTYSIVTNNAGNTSVVSWAEYN